MTDLSLSDPETRRFKVRQTWIISVCVAAVCLVQYVLHRPRAPAVVSLLLFVVMAGLVAVTVRSLFWQLADAVALDDDAGVIVTRGARRVVLAPQAVQDVSVIPFSLRRAVTLSLRDPVAPFGRRVTFLPPGWRTLDDGAAMQFVGLLKARLTEMARPA